MFEIRVKVVILPNFKKQPQYNFLHISHNCFVGSKRASVSFMACKIMLLSLAMSLQLRCLQREAEQSKIQLQLLIQHDIAKEAGFPPHFYSVFLLEGNSCI